MESVVTEHTARAFDADLEDLAHKITEMGCFDARQSNDAIEALAKPDIALAERIVAADDRVDELQREIEEKAITTIARRQPLKRRRHGAGEAFHKEKAACACKRPKFGHIGLRARAASAAPYAAIFRLTAEVLPVRRSVCSS
jgi:hypothetical protein